MTSWMRTTYTMLALLLIGFGLGLGLGWKTFRKVPTLANEKPEAQIIQQDHSTVLERTTNTAAAPVTQIPKGDKVLHQGFLTVVSPSGAAMLPMAGSGPQDGAPLPTPAPPTKIDYSLVEQPDGTDRLIFKGPAGTVIGGEDVVVNEPDRPRELKSTVGVTRYLHEQTYGIWVEHRLAFITIGAEVKQSRAQFGSGRLSTDAALRVGFSF